ncbi:hypothetical protein H310_02691 [Aphanomyces invadans]|uniref:Helicase-associated domain-containing protein n=1 Tax=Aphanomyces invadans TaxID=157072 RepID=A0A024UJV9_9STRA|nr:hypothetical protein H310_02691 [Aphanomyces invadans]ETW06435.1 hypothetical protein H310_02691 [Aphanomyces invadans]RHY33130.1 hypothetical protein DYB32_001972 [Aphanomyces invadans]|eukprot:XP_008864510.1 hypothetical protein H310_02691 [Aphanomyces invadans]
MEAADDKAVADMTSSPATTAASPRRRHQFDMASLLNGQLHHFPVFVEAATVLHTIQRDTTSFTSFPKLYTIPREPPWPPHLQGVKLNTAQVRMHYKHGNLHPDTLAGLRAVNFVFDVNQVKWSQKLLALATYKEIHGDLCVPQEFCIPPNDPRWPKDLWHMRLGLAVRGLRQKTKPSTERHKILSDMGFVWNILDLSWDTKVLALVKYKQFYGDLLVAYSFRVPTHDVAWPKETWGLKLGHAVHNIRQNGHEMSADRRRQLVALGFVWDHLEMSWDVKIVALQTYRSLFNSLNVPYGYVVPGESSLWPRETWHMKLGHAVHNIRQNLQDMPAARKAQLNEMGFVWHSLPLSWEMKVVALQVYHHTFGNLVIPPSFRIPDGNDSAWPKKTWYIRLADVADDVRRHHENLTPAQVRQLNELGFPWQDGESDASQDPVELISICDGFPLTKRIKIDSPKC